jgi:hypothetical protein
MDCSFYRFSVVDDIPVAAAEALVSVVGAGMVGPAIGSTKK